MERIGILTSGGDSPGMNAALLGAFEQAAAVKCELIGFVDGFTGLVRGTWSVTTPEGVMMSADKPGTMLGTSRNREIRGIAGLDRAIEVAKEARIRALIVIGGNGSLLAAQSLSEGGLIVAFIPATIDNDVPGTETTIGFDSAVCYAVDAVERLRITGHSLRGRGFLLQVLGGETSFLAIAVAQRGAVPWVLTVEGARDLGAIAREFPDRARDGEAIAIVAEGVGDAVRLASELTRLAGLRIHPTILGHAQRAASPTEFDRAIARAAGQLAVRELHRGRSVFVRLGIDAGVVARPLTSRSGGDPSATFSAHG